MWSCFNFSSSFVLGCKVFVKGNDFRRTGVSSSFSLLLCGLVEVSNSAIHLLNLFIPSRVSFSSGSSGFDMGGQSGVEIRERLFRGKKGVALGFSL